MMLGGGGEGKEEVGGIVPGSEWLLCAAQMMYSESMTHSGPDFQEFLNLPSPSCWCNSSSAIVLQAIRCLPASTGARKSFHPGAKKPPKDAKRGHGRLPTPLFLFH